MSSTIFHTQQVIVTQKTSLYFANAIYLMFLLVNPLTCNDELGSLYISSAIINFDESTPSTSVSGVCRAIIYYITQFLHSL